MRLVGAWVLYHPVSLSMLLWASCPRSIMDCSGNLVVKAIQLRAAKGQTMAGMIKILRNEKCKFQGIAKADVSQGSWSHENQSHQR